MKISRSSIMSVMDKWVKELEGRYQMFYKVVEGEVFVYGTNPGALIGKAGERINRYKKVLKDLGASRVTLVEVYDARMPDYSNWTAEDWGNL